MSLCINPDCPQPAHPENGRHTLCQACGAELILQGRYRVMRLLSSHTGFGLVYEAYERDAPKILKVLRRDRSTHPKVVELFQKEANVLSRIRHPGVPLVEDDGYFTVHLQGQDTPLHCIIMEKIDGPTLQQWMQQQGNHPISERQAFQWLLQLTDILQQVHQHNYFHRDIKPDNVMIRSSGQLVLVDFGAAREMTQTYLAQVGSLGVTTVSSAGYTPPEQEHGQAVPQSDFYALGRTLIYLLTARSPNDTSLYDPLRNTFHWRPYAPQVSDGFADLLDSLISPRVIDRPKNTQELLERLHQLSVQQWLGHTDPQVLLAETTLPANLGGAKGGSAYEVAPTHPELPSKGPGNSTLPLLSQVRLSGWTWLIAGGMTVLAAGLIGVGLWSRDRPSLPETPPPRQSPAAVPTLPVSLQRTFAAHRNSINALKLLSDKRRLLSASADATLRLWDLTSGETLQRYEGHTTFVNAIALSPDEQTLYSGSADGAIYQWHLQRGQKQAEYVGHQGPVNALDRTPDGRWLVSGGSDGTLKLWDTNRQTLVRTLTGHSGAVNALVVTADGQRVISGGADRTLKVWDLQTGDLLQTLEGHDSFINAIVVSPDGQIVFSASADQTIKRWRLSTGEVLDSLTAHDSYVNVLTLSRDGQTVSSGSADQTVRLWDVETGDLLMVYTGFGMPVDHLLIPSEKQLVTASRDNAAIKVWLKDP